MGLPEGDTRAAKGARDNTESANARSAHRDIARGARGAPIPVARGRRASRGCYRRKGVVFRSNREHRVGAKVHVRIYKRYKLRIHTEAKTFDIRGVRQKEPSSAEFFASTDGV